MVGSNGGGGAGHASSRNVKLVSSTRAHQRLYELSSPVSLSEMPSSILYLEVITLALTSLVIERILCNLVHESGRRTPILVRQYLVHTRLDVILRLDLIETEVKHRIGYESWEGGVLYSCVV